MTLAPQAPVATPTPSSTPTTSASSTPQTSSVTPDATAQSPFALLGAQARTVAALSRMGIETPTVIQSRAIPPLLAGRDVVGQSRTGSGKTVAFGLPLVERLDPRLRQLQALVLVPTRELAAQVAGVLAQLDAGRGLRLAQLIGGRALGPQREALAAGAQIAVGAPGRVLDLLRQGALDLRAVRVVVLDEADQLLDAGFARDVERILTATPRDRQTALFTATLPEWTTSLAQRYLHDPIQVDAGEPLTRPTDTVEQTVYLVPENARLEALIALLEIRRDQPGMTLVFGRTKHGIKRLAKQLEARGYPVAALQGNMSQNARDRVMVEVRAGRAPILLATNVAARGLDVLSIEQVINFELPESAELFTHRIGRTGRMERTGEAITLLTPDDLPAWQKIQRDLRLRLPHRPWPATLPPLPANPAPQSASPARPPLPERGSGQSAPRSNAGPRQQSARGGQGNRRGRSGGQHTENGTTTSGAPVWRPGIR